MKIFKTLLLAACITVAFAATASSYSGQGACYNVSGCFTYNTPSSTGLTQYTCQHAGRPKAYQNHYWRSANIPETLGQQAGNPARFYAPVYELDDNVGTSPSWYGIGCWFTTYSSHVIIYTHIEYRGTDMNPTFHGWCTDGDYRNRWADYSSYVVDPIGDGFCAA